MTFEEFNLPKEIIESLAKIKYTTPTPIQAQAIAIALEGKDILGSAQTGTGKTAAFTIPLITHLMKNSQAAGLILAPTRELAMQIRDFANALIGPKLNTIKTVLLIGGAPMSNQIKTLKGNPRLVIGTPGRINDHLRRGTLKLNNTQFLVLDEADRMLDMGFEVQLETIAKQLKKPRQTLMFSATISKNIVSLSKKYLTEPSIINVGSADTPPVNIQQDTIHTRDKYEALLKALEDRDGTVIIFVKTQIGTEKLTEKLMRAKHSADFIHGGLNQGRRQRVIQGFRTKAYRIMVATDVASRGLNIPHIEHVINYDIPECAEDYIHRIGRTARTKAQGFSLNLVSPEDKGKWRAIERFFNAKNNTEKGSNLKRAYR